MKQVKLIALSTTLLFASTSAMALRAPEPTAMRSRPAGSVIDVIMKRDGSIDRQSKQQAKHDRKHDKEVRKAARERDKELRKDAKEREKDRREAARDQAKDAREWQKQGRAKR